MQRLAAAFTPVRFFCAVLVVICAGECAFSGEATLKNGFLIEGTPRKLQALTMGNVRTGDQEVPNYFPLLLLENGSQRIFVPQKQVRSVVDRDDLGKWETYKFKQQKTGLKRMPASLGALFETTPFNEFGQRTHTIKTELGPRQIVVGVTKITPRYVAITGLDHQWDYGIATTSVPPASLDAMIQRVSDPKNPDHRFAIPRFYLQASMYDESKRALESIAKDFPELKERVAEVRKEVLDLEYRVVLQELSRRMKAGQHALAYEYAHAVPQQDASATVIHDVLELIRNHDAARERMNRARILLGEFQAKLDDAALVAAVGPLRSAVDGQLSFESLVRLDAFFNLVEDATLGPAEKLALAYSGWVVGSASAVTDLHAALRLWQARDAVLEYLGAELPRERSDRLKDLSSIEGVGPDTVLKLIRLLPPIVETPEARPGVAASIAVGGGAPDSALTYGVLLPPEYDSRHEYPLIVALHPVERPASAELEWWGGTPAKPGQAQRRGYIVVAPEYADAKAHEYDYSVAAHDAVLRALNDARRRFNIDSDRIYLSGHGMGGDAAFDIGMSHPDLFAGVIPIAGICAQFCEWYSRFNAGYTAWYIVNGEFDRNTFEKNALILERMMRGGMDVVLVEFVQRGYESYFEEIHRLFDWMELHRRQKPPKEFEMRVLRPSENRFYWLHAEGLPPAVLQPTVLAGESRGRVRPMLLKAKIMPGNTIYLTSGAKQHTVWLNPDLVDFEKRLLIKLHEQQKFHGFPQPSIEAILEDFRQRGDRQMLFTTRIELD